MKILYKVFSTPEELANGFAEEFISLIKTTGKKKKFVSIAISGGNTPKLFLSVLAEKYSGSIDWKVVKLFWVDERCVPPDNSESNYGMTEKILLGKINIPPEQIFRMRGEDDPSQEAERYSDLIRKHITHKNNSPVFDIIILGMGEDGHTASIFPGSEKLFSATKNCAVTIHPSTGQKRITVTGKVINNSRSVFFLVTGSNKSRIVYEIYRNSEDSRLFPSAHVKLCNGRITWFLDDESGKFIV
jgi:6-phosphogluconolactonase